MPIALAAAGVIGIDPPILAMLPPTPPIFAMRVWVKVVPMVMAPFFFTRRCGALPSGRDVREGGALSPSLPPLLPAVEAFPPPLLPLLLPFCRCWRRASASASRWSCLTYRSAMLPSVIAALRFSVSLGSPQKPEMAYNTFE